MACKILCAAVLLVAIQMAMSSPTHCGCVPSCRGYDSGYGYGCGYGSGYGSEFGDGYGYGCGCSKVVKLPIFKKTTVVRQPFVHETRQAVVTVHEPSVKNTHADRPQVSSYVQKACKSYVQNEAPVIVPHPVIPTPTCDDHEGSYYSGSYCAPSPISYSQSYPSTCGCSSPVSYSAPSYRHGGCGCY